MTGKYFARIQIMAVVVAGGTVPVPALAQTQPCPCMINSICCQCADGSTKQVDLSTGQAPWRVTLPGGTSSSLVVGNQISNWTAALPPAQWVTPPGAPQTLGNYTYTLQYNIPNCVIPANVAITVQFAADDSATIPGTTFTASGFNAGTIPTFTLPPTFTTPGPHTLTVIVNNSFTYTGLLLKATLTTRCPLQTQPGQAATGSEVFGPTPVRPDVLVTPTPR